MKVGQIRVFYHESVAIKPIPSCKCNEIHFLDKFATIG